MNRSVLLLAAISPLRRSMVALLILLLSPITLLAQDHAPDVRVLPADFNSDKTTQMMRSYLRNQVHAALDQRLEKLEALDSHESIKTYQQELREVFSKAIGPLPERTPLNARIVAELEYEEYFLHKILFESQPGFFVTGNLYLPKQKAIPAFPGILLPCGHSKNGKAYTSYQQAAILLARTGFAVFCYDPIGQGERHQLFDDQGEVLNGGSGEHQALGVAPIMLGRGLATHFIWDGMRALDYLASIPYVDPTRLGCTGNSGGGNLTAMLMALDDRIQAAAPGCFMATTRTKNESPGPGDAEQNIFAQVRDGLDHPDFAIMRAPKPTLYLTATHDFVPIEGAWTNFRQAKRVYTKLGHPQAVELIETDEEHGFSKQLREGAVRFFARWLQDRQLEVFEPDEVPVATDAELQVTPEGEVMKLHGARSLPELNREFYSDHKSPRQTGNDLRDLVREVTGIRDSNNLSAATRVETPEEAQRGISPMLLSPEKGILLPCYRKAAGDDPQKEVHLVVHDLGISSTASDAEALVFGKRQPPDNYTILGVDLRDIGETKTRNWRYYGADATIAYMLGRSYLAMRSEDILTVARFQSEQHDGSKIHLHAWGELLAPAMHAAALEPELFESANFHGGDAWGSWETLLDDKDPMSHIHTVVHGALLHYDLPELMELIPKPDLLP